MLDTAPSWSLRRRVTAISAFAILAAVVGGGGAMYWAAQFEEDRTRDARLQHLASAVRSFVEHEVAETGTSGTWGLESVPAPALMYRLQVWSREGVLLLRSDEALAGRPLVDLDRVGFSTVVYAGEEYRTYSLQITGGSAVIVVAECLDEWSEQLGLLTAFFMAFLLLPFGLVAAGTWWLMGYSFRHLDSLAVHLCHRNPLDTTYPRFNRPPAELYPILRALDDLDLRINRAISVERRFTSVAAHELRTPLAAIRAQAQLVCAGLSSAETTDALRALMRGVDRASGMLDQLLDLARIENMGTLVDLSSEPVDVASIFRAVVNDLGSKADARRISIQARFQVSSIRSPDSGLALHLLLRNLVTNAIAYSPDGGRVEVATHAEGDVVVLTVDDTGKGIPPQDRERAFERFNRLGQSKIEGSGLGLSIVLLVVEMHCASVQLLDSPLGGLRVRVAFPTQAQPAAAPPLPDPAIV